MEKLLYNPERMQLLLPSQLGNINVVSLLASEEEVPPCPCSLWASTTSCTRFDPFATSTNSSIRCLCNQSIGVSFCCISRSAQRMDDACHLSLWIWGRKFQLSSTIPTHCVSPVHCRGREKDSNWHHKTQKDTEKKKTQGGKTANICERKRSAKT